MKTPALKLNEKDLDQCMELGQSMEEGLKDKPAFAGVSPAPAAMKTKRDAITAQRGVIANAEALVTQEENTLAGMEEDYRTSLTLMASSAANAVQGDEDQLTAANIPLRKAGTPTSDTPPPLENVSGTYGDLSGEVDWSWNGRPGRAVYTGETATSANGPFTHAYAGTRSKFTSKGHAPGSEVFMRVRCNCNGFDSEWSQIVSQRAR